MIHDPDTRTLTRLPEGTPPRLLVVVDTEEEFDWSQFDRANTSVEAMRQLHLGQELCDRHGIVPTYVSDHPVVTQQPGIDALRSIHRERRCEIGAHLHPWVTPPFTETVCARNSYPGNLPRALEQQKLRALGDAIERAFGVRPLAYKAGRYGIGPNTARILEAEGYEVDLSPSPAYDFSADGGPDFRRVDARPYWFGATRRLLCIPNTGSFTGCAGRLAPALLQFATRPLPSRLRVPGILSRLGIVSRIRLSPEGFGLDSLVALTRHLLAREQQVFTLSYHSSSLQPGCTQYVRTADERDRFLGVMNDYMSWFLHDLGGKASTPRMVRDEFAAAGGAS